MKIARLFFLTIFILIPSGVKATITIQKCMICHGKSGFKKVEESGKIKELYINLSVIENSIHKKKICTDCHADVIEIPHRHTPEKVKCVRCHYNGNPKGAPQSDKYLEYQKSIHARALEKGNPKAPACQECHGNHDIRHTKDVLSRVSKFNVARTCGHCHMDIFAQYVTSIHGKALLLEHKTEAPNCTDCHGEHNIFAPAEPESTVNPVNVVKTCAHCHESVDIVGKYGIETTQVALYEHSFHGIAVKFGSKTVANCASCHGTHNILPPGDPDSPVNINNIPKTCGQPKCHPGANKNYARGKIHVNPKSRESGIIFYTGLFFKYLTILTIVALIIHILLDLNRRSKEWREQKKKQ